MIRRLLLRCFFVWLRCRGYCYRLRFRSTLWIWGGRLNSGRRNRLLVPLRCTGNRGTVTIGSDNIFVTLSPIKDKVTYLQNQIIFKERKNS